MSREWTEWKKSSGLGKTLELEETNYADIKKNKREIATKLYDMNSMEIWKTIVQTSPQIPVTNVFTLCEVAKEQFLQKFMLLIKILLSSKIYKPVAIEGTSPVHIKDSVIDISTRKLIQRFLSFIKQLTEKGRILFSNLRESRHVVFQPKIPKNLQFLEQL